MMMKYIILVVALLSPSWLLAHTWMVEKDGSGDFTVIQDAVDSAAEGDTIRIGIGRFSDYSPYTVPAGFTINTFVRIVGKSVVLQGSGRDQTTVGPDTYWYDDTHNPIGVLVLNVPGQVTIMDIGVENVADGVYTEPASLILERCGVSQCNWGLLIAGLGDGVRVSECHFDENRSYGIISVISASNLEILGCEFSDNPEAIHIQDTMNVLISNCIIENSIHGGIGLSASQNCVVSQCQLFNNRNGVKSSTSSCELYDTTIEGGDTQVSASNGGYIIGSRNILTGGLLYTVRMVGGYVTLPDSRILHEAGNIITVSGYHDYHPPVLDFTNCYWGITDTDSISALIWDGNDDPTIPCVIDFDPLFATILDEPMGWGDVKRLFR